MIFAASFPSWTGADGFPLSWRHFNYGMHHIGRRTLRESLSAAQAVRIGNAAKDDFDDYARTVARMTEVPRYG